MIVPPTSPPLLSLRDLEGEPVQLDQGRKIWLSLFREATCPFCNYRVYELTQRKDWLKSLNLDLILVFASGEAAIRQYIARRPRPFRMVADPDNRIHQDFQIPSSLWGKIKAMMLRMPALLKGMGMVGMAGMKTGNLLPADFLIDERGMIVTAYYGADAGDHIPLDQVEAFAKR